jgi:hypothetical protein
MENLPYNCLRMTSKFIPLSIFMIILILSNYMLIAFPLELTNDILMLTLANVQAFTLLLQTVTLSTVFKYVLTGLVLTLDLLLAMIYPFIPLLVALSLNIYL